MFKLSMVTLLVAAAFGWLVGGGGHPAAALTPTPTSTAVPSCVDPTPDGGGEMRFKGIGQIAHIVTRAGDVCPGATETWTFSTVDLGSVDQYVTVQVLVDVGLAAARVTLVDGTEVTLAVGTSYQTTQRYGTVAVTVSGVGSRLATYRVQACRALTSSPCALSATSTPKPGDVNCDGSIDARDAFSILSYAAGLASPACINVAETYIDGFINSIDAEILLQYDAGLIAELLPGF